MSVYFLMRRLTFNKFYFPILPDFATFTIHIYTNNPRIPWHYNTQKIMALKDNFQHNITRKSK